MTRLKNIRVNAISAGPIKTLAARGVGALGEMMRPTRPRTAASQRGPVGGGGAALFLAATWQAP